MSQVGRYRGQWYVKLSHDTVFPHIDRPLRSRWYFLADNKGKVAGDHFKTLKELRTHVDKKLAED